MIEEHQEYYYEDPDTGDAVWEAPAHLAWTTHTNEEDGSTFYHNTATGDSTYDKPAMYAWRRIENKSEL